MALREISIGAEGLLPLGVRDRVYRRWTPTIDTENDLLALSSYGSTVWFGFAPGRRRPYPLIVAGVFNKRELDKVIQRSMHEDPGRWFTGQLDLLSTGKIARAYLAEEALKPSSVLRMFGHIYGELFSSHVDVILGGRLTYIYQPQEAPRHQIVPAH